MPLPAQPRRCPDTRFLRCFTDKARTFPKPFPTARLKHWPPVRMARWLWGQKFLPAIPITFRHRDRRAFATRVPERFPLMPKRTAMKELLPGIIPKLPKIARSLVCRGIRGMARHAVPIVRLPLPKSIRPLLTRSRKFERFPMGGMRP